MYAIPAAPHPRALCGGVPCCRGSSWCWCWCCGCARRVVCCARDHTLCLLDGDKSGRQPLLAVAWKLDVESNLPIARPASLFSRCVPYFGAQSLSLRIKSADGQWHMLNEILKADPDSKIPDGLRLLSIFENDIAVRFDAVHPEAVLLDDCTLLAEQLLHLHCTDPASAGSRADRAQRRPSWLNRAAVGNHTHLGQSAWSHEVVNPQRCRRLDVWWRRLDAAALSRRQQRDITAVRIVSAVSLQRIEKPIYGVFKLQPAIHCTKSEAGVGAVLLHTVLAETLSRLCIDSRLVGALPGVPPSVRCALAGRAASECRPSVVTMGGALIPGIGSRSRLPVQNA